MQQYGRGRRSSATQSHKSEQALVLRDNTLSVVVPFGGRRYGTALHRTALRGTARRGSPRLAAVLFCRGRTFSSLLPKALAARGKKRQARVCRQKRLRKFISPSENVYFVRRARVAVTIAVTPVEIDSFASG